MEEVKVPKKKKPTGKKIRIITKHARGPVKLLRLMIEQNPTLFSEVALGDKGDVLWFAPPFRDPDLDYIGDRLINFIPGFSDVSEKKELSKYLATMTAFFPEAYTFYPKTWLFPEQSDEVLAAMGQGRTQCYIIKPTLSSQGDGITIVKSEREVMSRLGDVVIQEYIDPPMLLYNKKFDLRIYVAITNVEPFVAFICEEGMVRFCTENYEEPTTANFSNACMHLTNYSINKLSPKYIRSDELEHPTEATKQTITSLKNTFAELGYDWGPLWDEVKNLVAKSLISVQPWLVFSRNEVIGKSGRRNLRGFHIIGFDVLIDAELKPWLLEINNHPSLSIDFESEHSCGPELMERSLVDEHIKTIAVKGAILIARKSVERQTQLGTFQNYTRILPMGCNYDTEIHFLGRLWRLFDYLSGVRGSKFVTSGRFRKIGIWLKEAGYTSIDLMSLDILYKTLTIKAQAAALNWFLFLEALKKVAGMLTTGSSHMNALSLLLDSVESHYQ
mmetsp:Transcript_32989/g.58010  ORF Transcript_32989/g.58010 Transcript_32989/m.58010 type:complete len:501 (+) Transcript_32989:2162-3664(+)